MEQRATRKLLDSLHTFSPIFLLLIFIGAYVVSTITTASKPKDGSLLRMGTDFRQPTQSSKATGASCKKQRFSAATKRVFNGLSAMLIVTYFGDAAVCVVHVVMARYEWWCGQSLVIYIVGSTFFYTVLLISMFDNASSPTIVQLTCWSAAVPIELVILSMSLTIYSSFHRERAVGDPLGGPVRESITLWETMEVVSDSVRILTLVTLILLYASKSGLFATDVERSDNRSNRATETTRLLDPSQVGNDDTNSQIFNPINDGPLPTTSNSQDPSVHQATIPTGSWLDYLLGYSIFLPYIWPFKSYRLKLVTLACVFLLMVQRINNVMVPNQVGVITTALANQQEAHVFDPPWSQILLYVFYRWLQTGLSSLRSALWIPVSQYSSMELSTAAFEHVHNLGLDFHLKKNTGELLSALNKSRSVTGLLEQILFELIPTLFDLIIAIGYFLIFFDAYYALVVGISSFSYIYCTVRVGLWRAKTKRDMVNASRYEDAVKNESIVAYRTVKLFNAEKHEFDRFRTAVSNYQNSEYYSSLRGTVLNTLQSTILMTGLLCTCFIAAYQVSTVQQPVGLFVTLLMYMAQLQGPLGYFGSFYVSIQSTLINAERILELFRERSTVVDSPLAMTLESCKGEIRFQNIVFFYDEKKPILNGLTFTCKPGTITALVGESGMGKSTVFQILYRFYNPINGSVHVDERDVRDLTIDSIRRHIGMVPQDSTLFNESLMYNLKYANQSATDEEVYRACRAAGIHDKIMAFADGYNSKVGDLGLRLSGGERQRVAIARAILKDTRIILLDEATSALDTDSETHVQKSLKALSHDRTIIVIAHRLSTITEADCILVLHQGQVVERGTHTELLELNGRYTRMWQNQTRESADPSSQKSERC